jgi:Right handed beta helix region
MHATARQALRVLVALFALAPFSALQADHVLPGMILKSVTLGPDGNPHRLRADTLIMKDAKVTCKPGTVIVAPATAKLVVYGRLLAEETLFRPVEPERGEPEHWGGIQFLGAIAGESRLIGCKVIGAGAGTEGALYFSGEASAEVTRCEIAESASDGIVCMNATPVCDGNRIHDCRGAAIRLKEFGFPNFPSRQEFTANGTDATVLEWDAAPMVDVALPRSGEPYHIPRTLAVRDGCKLAIEPGTRLAFESPTGQLLVYGTLTAQGTADAPILFGGARDGDGRGLWSGVEFRGQTCNASVLSYCHIAGAGAGTGQAAVTFTGALGSIPRPTLAHCEIVGSAGDGLRSVFGAPVVDDLAIRNCAGKAVVMSSGGFVDFATPCVVEGNESNAAHFGEGGIGITFPQRWKQPGMPYVLDGPLATKDGAPLDIDPGVELQLAPSASLFAEGAPIRAEGTAEAPIVIRGIPDAGVGEWASIVVMTGGGGTTLRHCHSRRGGAGGTPHLLATGAALNGGLVIEHCSFTEGSGPGLWLQDSFVTLSATRVSGHGGAGIVATGAAEVTIARCRIQNNKGGGLHAMGNAAVALTPGNVLQSNGKYDVTNASSRTIQARGNWWGTARAEEIAAHIFDHAQNPALGQVIFEPFMTEAPGEPQLDVTAAAEGPAETP